MRLYQIYDIATFLYDLAVDLMSYRKTRKGRMPKASPSPMPPRKKHRRYKGAPVSSKIENGQVVLYDGCEVTVIELRSTTAIVKTRQGNNLNVRIEFLKPA